MNLAVTGNGTSEQTLVYARAASTMFRSLVAVRPQFGAFQLRCVCFCVFTISADLIVLAAVVVMIQAAHRHRPTDQNHLPAPPAASTGHRTRTYGAGQDGSVVISSCGFPKICTVDAKTKMIQHLSRSFVSKANPICLSFMT